MKENNDVPVRCPYRFFCIKKQDCTDLHDNQEKKFFESNQTLKTKMCNYDGNCYILEDCKFAHTDEIINARNKLGCTNCKLRGHVKTSCNVKCSSK